VVIDTVLGYDDAAVASDNLQLRVGRSAAPRAMRGEHRACQHESDKPEPWGQWRSFLFWPCGLPLLNASARRSRPGEASVA
jgi:hypothetical protein